MGKGHYRDKGMDGRLMEGCGRLKNEEYSIEWNNEEL